MYRGRLLAATALTFALLTGATACGGGDDGGDKQADENQEPTEFGDLKPEDVRASSAEVADGFRELDRYAAEVVAKLGEDEPAAEEAQERLLTIWESILGTVKVNDSDAYDKLDAALSLLMTVRGKDDKAGAQKAADTVKETGAAYLNRFPSSGSASPNSTSTSSPSSSTEPSSDSDSDVDSDSGGDADPPISY